MAARCCATRWIARLAANKVTPMDGILSWWDGVELWLSGLAFVLQAIVVMPVVLVLAWGVAVGLDSLLGQGIRVMRRVRAGSASSPGSTKAPQ